MFSDILVVSSRSRTFSGLGLLLFIVSYGSNAPREFDEIIVSFSEGVASFILIITSTDDPVESDD